MELNESEMGCEKKEDDKGERQVLSTGGFGL